VLFLDEPSWQESPGLPSEASTLQDWAADLVDLLDSRPRFLDLDSIPPPR